MNEIVNSARNGQNEGQTRFFMSSRFWALVGMIAVAAALRLVPHLPNFSPVAAMALFGGALFGRRSLAFAIPLLAMFVSDLVIGFHAQMPAVYVSFVLITALGFWMRDNRTPARVAGTSLAASLLFFFVTNFAVWAQTDIYQKNMNGLVACYVAALPFLQNSLGGDLFYTAVFFGTWALAERIQPQWRKAPELV